MAVGFSARLKTPDATRKKKGIDDDDVRWLGLDFPLRCLCSTDTGPNVTFATVCRGEGIRTGRMDPMPG